MGHLLLPLPKPERPLQRDDFRLIINLYVRHRAAESVAAQQRRCELSKGLVSRARMLHANSESNREPERERASKREPERAGEQARESQREPE